MYRKSPYLLILIMLVGLTGCITSESVRNDIADTETKAYQDWQQQKSAAASRDTTQQVNPDVYSAQSENLPVITGKVELMDAIKLALKFNRDIKTAVENTRYAGGRIMEAYGGVLPTATLNGTYNRIDKVAEINLGGQSIKAGSIDNYTFNLHIEQPLFNGAAVAGLRAAKLYNALSDKQVQNVSQNIIFGIQQGYYQLLLLKKTYQVNKEYLKVSEASLTDVQNKAKFGSATDFNVLRAKVDVSNARTQMIKSRNDMQQAEAALFKMMGVSQNSKITLADSLDFSKMDITQNKAVELALQNNPEIASSLLSVRLNEQNVLAGYSRYMPSVSAYLNQNYQNPNPHGSFFNPDNYYKYGYAWNAGITLRFNIFDLSREGSLVQSKSQLRQQKLSYLNTREQVLYDVQSALYDLTNSEQSVEAQKLTVQQAKKGLHLAEVGLQNGTLDQVSVLDTRQALRQAELSYYSSLFQHKVARLKLLKATGQLKLTKVKQNASTPNN